MPHRRIEQAFDGIAIQKQLLAFIERAVGRYGTTETVKPPHRTIFHWPPPSISHRYHVLASDWTGKSELIIQGERFAVEIARTNFGVFGRCPELWHDARGESESDMLQNLASSAEPLLNRQRTIARTLEIDGRFEGEVSSLQPLDLLKLLYCEDRDVANLAHQVIEVSHFRSNYLPALCTILNDRAHPWRRSAQWCVLDLFEDLPSYIESEKDELEATLAMKGLLWDAQDDFARTVYKAGVVMGGHLPHRKGGEALLECLESPSLIGRRSAIHGLFHVVEWVPEMQDRVVHALRDHAKTETDPQLSIFSFAMADDIETGGVDHTPEPVFAFERD